MFEEYAIVRLGCDLEAKDPYGFELDAKVLKAGTRGAVVMVFPGEPPKYEVEFVDDDGNTLAIETVSEEQIRRVD